MGSGSDGVDWEGVAKRQLASEAEARGHKVSVKAHAVGSAFERGELTENEVRAFRNQVAAMLDTVEREIIGRHPEFTGYNNGDPYVRSYGMVADYLDVDTRQVDELLDGATATVGDAAITALAGGEAVTIETDAGTPLTLEPGESVDVNPGP